MRGTVGSFREKREARSDAERVHGVKKVDNDLEVRILTDDRRADAELRGMSSRLCSSTAPSLGRSTRESTTGRSR